jgi:hypothetical protein
LVLLLPTCAAAPFTLRRAFVPHAHSTAIRGHAGVHPLSQPGSADLSAWVDFSAMRVAAEQAFDLERGGGAGGDGGGGGAGSGGGGGAAAGDGEAGSSSNGGGGGSSSSSSRRPRVEVHGPVSQAALLHSLGIQARLQALAEVCACSWGVGSGRMRACIGGLLDVPR